MKFEVNSPDENDNSALFTFRGKYFLLTLILLTVEICIALFIKDTLVRPFVGDVLVVALIYCFLRIFLRVTYWKLALGVFLLACLIEVLQFYDYVRLLQMENNRIISTILGRTFEWKDFIAYFIGFLFIISAEKYLKNRK